MKDFNEVLRQANEDGVHSPVGSEVGSDDGPDGERCENALPWNFTFFLMNKKTKIALHGITDNYNAIIIIVLVISNLNIDLKLTLIKDTDQTSRLHPFPTQMQLLNSLFLLLKTGQNISVIQRTNRRQPSIILRHFVFPTLVYLQIHIYQY